MPSLLNLQEEPTYSQRKNLFIECRKAFRANPNATIELMAYEHGDNDYAYTLLKGFVPQNIIGNAVIGGGISYGKSDTFFTDFARHHPENYVLSATDHSLVIGNQASHDTRLYSARWNPESKGSEAAASMSYMHLMVIPTQKIYNIVALDNTEVINEMMTHFKSFWSTHTSIQKSIDRVQLALQLRAREVFKGLEAFSDPIVRAERIAEFNSVMIDVRRSSDEFATRANTLVIGDFVFGFHPAPHASIGHLHMHVLATPIEFRHHSTDAHDWKTVPAKAVIEVLQEEKEKVGMVLKSLED